MKKPPVMHRNRTVLSQAHALSVLGVLGIAGLASARSAAPQHVERYQHTIHSLASPAAVAFDDDDLLWIAEAGRHRVRAFTTDGKPEVTFGSPGSGAGELLDPRGIAANSELVFVADSGNDRIQVFGHDGTHVRSFGRRGAARGELRRPTGLALHEDRLAVCDTGNRRVQVFSITGEALAVLAPAGDKAFQRPVDVAFDRDGRLIVADADLHRVLVFDAEGREVTRFGNLGWFPGLFYEISGVSTLGDRIAVSDAENHRVQIYTPSGDYESKWGLHAIRPREGKGKLHYPAHLAHAPSGRFAALAEPLDDRVQIFGEGEELVEGGDVFRQSSAQPSPHYGFRLAASQNWMTILEPETDQISVYDIQLEQPRRLAKIGGYGKRMGLLDRPSGLDLDGESLTLLVSELGKARLQLIELRIDRNAEVVQNLEMAKYVKAFDLERLGKQLGDVTLDWTIEPTDVLRDAAGQVYVLDGANARIHVFDRDFGFLRTFGGYGDGPGQLRGPTDFALDAERDRLYVADELNGRVEVFTTQGRPAGSRSEGLERPYGVAVTPGGRLFVSDVATHQVLRFTPEGELDKRIGQRGIRRVEFFKPRDVDVDAKGHLVVLDHGNHRGQWLTQSGEYIGSFGSRLYTKPARLPETYDPADYTE